MELEPVDDSGQAVCNDLCGTLKRLVSAKRGAVSAYSSQERPTNAPMVARSLVLANLLTTLSRKLSGKAMLIFPTTGKTTKHEFAARRHVNTKEGSKVHSKSRRQLQLVLIFKPARRA